MKYLPGIGALNIFVRNMKQSGLAHDEVVARIRRRLNLERFDPAAMDEGDRKRYEELTEFLRKLQQGQ